jgi:hypothetical protein
MTDGPEIRPRNLCPIMRTRDELADHFRWQAEWCHRLGSPLYGGLLERIADDIDVVWPVLADDTGGARSSFIALRFMGAVHRLVLEGRAPVLADYYPSAGGTAKGSTVWEAFRHAVVENADELVRSSRRSVQTNEVGRSAALVGGFLEVARGTDLPLRILEIGTSAGLNLRWDHFRYEARGQTWGDPSSPVRLCDFNSERPLPFDVEARVTDRAGCDAMALDPTTRDGLLTLTSYTWPDQHDRLRRLRAAVEVAGRVPARVERSDAADWLERRLAAPSPGSATVVFHSIFWPYVSDEGRARIRKTLERAGDAAGADWALAWLRMEPAGDHASVRLKMWPGGDDREVAQSGYHGAHVRWLL